MSDRIFAFQIARPLDAAPSEQEAREAQYDPQTQSLQWQGQTRAQATILYCTAHHNGYWNCTANGLACHAWGIIRVTGGYVCDGR